MIQTKKSLLAFLFIMSLILVLTACNSKNPSQPEKNIPQETLAPVQTDPPTEPPTEPSTEPEETIPEEAQAPYEAATAFLQETTDDMYIYTEHDFLPKTVAGLTTEGLQRLKDEISQQPNNTVLESADMLADKIGGNLVDRIEKFPVYYKSYVDYYRKMRKEGGIMREKYLVRYYFHSIEQDGNFAELHLSEGISYNYVGETEGSAEGIEWVVWMWDNNGEWVVLDMLDDFGRNLGRNIDYDHLEQYENGKSSQDQSTQE